MLREAWNRLAAFCCVGLAESALVNAQVGVLYCVFKVQVEGGKSPATRNRTRDHLIAATLYSQMLYQLSYSRSDCILTCHASGAMNWAQA